MLSFEFVCGFSMRNHSLLLWVLLLMYGVYGADVGTVKPVSVMKGDSVTLHTGVTELQRDDKIEWMNEKRDIIAQIENNITFIHEDRLELDHKTGSLTIRKIAENRLYELHIRGDQLISKTFNVTVHDEVVSASVIEGDSVTLHTGVTKKQRDDQIVWKFGEQGDLIADLNSPVDSSWKNIHLNDQTGDLTIRNIQIDQSGDYKMEINNISMILHRKFYMAVGEMKTVSVMEGEPSILYTGLIEIQGHDLILWKFKDHLIAEIKKETNRFLTHDNNADGRFKGRLQLHYQSGSLTIRGSRITDSGEYHLYMGSSSYTLQRNISVSVTDSSNSGAVSGICSASVGLLVWAVTVFLLQEV